MPSLTYVARQPGPFAALVQAAEIGGLRLHPLPPIRVRDRFYDSDDAELLQRGLVLRVRDQDGARTAALRVLACAEGPTHLPDDVELSGDARRLDLPPGPLADVVRDTVRGDRLHVLLALRQYRTPRVAFDGERPLALLSFDVVVYEVPGAQVVSNEVEVEPLGEAEASDIECLAATFRQQGMEPVADTKVERGIRRLPRSLSKPALVLPRERVVLEAALASGSPLLQRRARVVLLDARGFRPDTIAAQTGLSMARVRYWRQRFREVRLEILNGDLRASPRRSPPRPTFPGSVQASGAAPPTTTAALATPPAGPPAEPAGVESAGMERGGLASEAPAPSGDMTALLAMFSPSETETPLLDHDALADGDAEDEDPDIEEWSSREPARTTTSETTGALRAAYPVVIGPFASTVPATSAQRAFDPTEPGPQALPGGDGATVRTPRIEREEGGSPRAEPGRPRRRPVLSGETSLLHAAQATIAYHVASLEDALARLAAGRSDADARRLLIACHRVRLSVESFRMVLPERASACLLLALRPLVADLDCALDLGRAAEVVDTPEAPFADRRARALESALQRLDGDRQRAWGGRARRLLARLDAQRADGLLLGDDFPLPPDDFVGQPGDLPMPSRLRHVLGSMVWARYEAIRVFEDEIEREVEPEVAYHLAIAASGLHFVLGLAANAAAESVRDLAAFLNDIEQVLGQYRHRAQTAELLGEWGPGPDRSELANRAVRAWEALSGPAFRGRIAAVVASI